MVLPDDAKEAAEEVSKAYGGVSDPQVGARLANVRSDVSPVKTAGIVADIKIGDEVIGTYSRVVDPWNNTVIKSRTEIDPSLPAQGDRSRGWRRPRRSALPSVACVVSRRCR